MDKKQSQLGNANLIIIVILLIALIGALCFIFWQNYIQPKSTIAKSNANNASLNIQISDELPATVNNDGTAITDKNSLAITKWGIKGTYKGTHPIKYEITDINFATFTSSDMTGNCSEAAVSSIMRLSGDQKLADVMPVGVSDTRTIAEAYAVDAIGEFSGNKHIGNFYYLYISPQQICHQTDTQTADTIQPVISSDVHEYFKTLTAI